MNRNTPNVRAIPAILAAVTLLASAPALAATSVAGVVENAVRAAIPADGPSGPVAELDAIRKDFDALLQRATNATFEAVALRNDATPPAGPTIDVDEQSDRYVLHVRAPELGEDDVGVSVEGRVVTVTVASVRTVEKTGANGEILVRAASTSEYVRTITLDEPVDVSRMSTMGGDDGLTIVLPKEAGATTE